MKLFLFLVVTILFASCSHKYAVIIQNSTSHEITDMHVAIQGKDFIVKKIAPFGIAKFKYKPLELPGDNHNFRIESEFKTVSGTSNYGSYFTDLSGVPYPVYTIRVSDSTSYITNGK